MIRIIAGTNRPGSNTLKVARRVETAYQAMKEPVELLNLLDLPAELFTPAAYAEKPAGLKRFTDAVLASSRLGGGDTGIQREFPGVLKYFIDHLPFPESFEKRPVCFIGLAAGMWGALRAVEQLQTIFGYRNAYLYPERVFLPKIHEVLDGSGGFKDAALAERVAAQAAGFREFVRRVRGD
ncbi:MAG: NAD(P)H-dependent oxidoreductase [Bdellovibrionaceae bacterium]|nr:NAD(P)H-dependent oxidoreductase [Pseudobdellovibrionaceae bacterium]